MFKFFSAARKVTKLIMGGYVVEKIDVRANAGMTTVSLQRKINSETGQYYIVLAELTPGNFQFVAFDQGEFASFANAVAKMQEALAQQAAGIQS
ncbi:hypothetical protein CO669_25655 [Bradyrhizobium sp. Y36]|nr:hypothetical protein CO669_25655 [Bradyrhizobium sp. Y36]